MRTNTIKPIHNYPQKLLGALLIALIASPAAMAVSEEGTPQQPYSKVIGENFPRNVYWGDTHLHTNLSQDANNFGVKLGPDEAYRFAKGEPVTATHGQQAQLKRPLDFLVIADHAEGIGSMQQLQKGDKRLLKNPRLKMWRELQIKNDVASRQKITEDGRVHGWPEELDLDAIRRPVWDDLVKLAEHYNEPGKFTALNGFEWTSHPGGSNLHRVVLFRDGVKQASTVVPFSALVSSDPEKLWDYMDDYERNSGGRMLAIPHNGNISNGLLFLPEKRHGEAFDNDYAARRAAREPLYEVTQIKGDGETHPLLSPNDEFADYETWDQFNFAGVAKTDAMIPHEYAREALKTGLKLEQELGTNPFKFGMIGSTDSHTGLSTPEEDNFYGKHSGGLEPNDHRMEKIIGKAREKIMLGWQQAASGYAAVWAKENTRESLWDAMYRKEVYATTGSRITLRFFAGWDYQPVDAVAPDIAEVGYAKGVPMGGDLGSAPKGKAPSFLIAAWRDPLAANLDRVQMVKGWLDENGDSQEKVYDVVWSDQGNGRKIKRGKLAAVGNTVDIQTASYTNSIGAAQLTTVWQDKDFDPSQRAFYYLRVLEIPTPHWTTYDQVRFGVEQPKGAPKIHQERAYSSPVWYTP